mmetsp:Transcript_79448/g.257280  ORF Transcript_79448/g.257280 Transcript_79448/m.257280 type:complete len:117 (-) Transcript_79448:120-470(-)
MLPISTSKFSVATPNVQVSTDTSIRQLPVRLTTLTHTTTPSLASVLLHGLVVSLGFLQSHALGCELGINGDGNSWHVLRQMLYRKRAAACSCPSVFISWCVQNLQNSLLGDRSSVA